jgi:lipid-A-disaccharide synthase
MRRRILVSAGEASGDLYAALVVEELRRTWPDADFFGCTGPRLRAAGVKTVVDAASLAVVGLVEVVAHLPRIYGEYRKLLAAVDEAKTDLAILADSPDFHLRVAKQLHARGVPVAYLVAPQVWAWRKGRVKTMRRVLRHLLCIFPFEKEFFEREGIRATYIGHPLAALVKPSMGKEAFFRKHGLDLTRPLVAVLPGSRRGEAARHLPALMDAAGRLVGDGADWKLSGKLREGPRQQPLNFLLPASANTGAAFFRQRLGESPIRVIEGESWDAMAHADLALAASGTVTVEAALLGTPMVTFYKVTAASWAMGKMLVDVPFYSMVNLVAGSAVVPELMQDQMTGERIAQEARRLLTDAVARGRMQAGLAEVREKLSGGGNAPQRAAAIIHEILEGQAAHVS